MNDRRTIRYRIPLLPSRLSSQDFLDDTPIATSVKTVVATVVTRTVPTDEIEAVIMFEVGHGCNLVTMAPVAFGDDPNGGIRVTSMMLVFEQVIRE